MNKTVNPLELWEDAISAHEQLNDNRMPQDLVAAAGFVARKVEDFLSKAALITKRTGDRNVVICGANENFQVNNFADTVNPDTLYSLMTELQIPTQYQASCAKRVGGIIIQQLTSKSAMGVWNNYDRAANQNDGSVSYVALESIFPTSVLGSINSGSGVSAAAEAFGINMNNVLPDMKLSLTVALMQYITGFSHLLFPTVATTQPEVIIKREVNSVVDMSDPTKKRTRMIELYRTPALVNSSLKRVHPLVTNDSTNTYLIADDILKFGAPKANLQELALIVGTPGWDRFNHTDLIADSVVFEDVILEMVQPAAGGDPAVTEQFRIKVPRSSGRFTSNADSMSSDRFANCEFETILTKDTPMVLSGGSTTSTLLAGLGANDGIIVRYTLSGAANLEFCTISAMANAHLVGYNKVAGAAISVAVTTALTAVGATTKLVGYTVDAKYSEENLRKSTLRSTLDYKTMHYHLPTGRAIVIDYAYGENAEANAAARLAQIDQVGADVRNLDIYDGVSNSVSDELKMYAANPGMGQLSVSDRFAAGDIVNPYVFSDTMDFAGVVSVRSSDAAGDIKQFVLNKLNAIASDMFTKTMYRSQLVNGAQPVLRILTSEWVKSAAFMCKRIHAHLEKEFPSNGEVAYVMELDGGVRCEIVTTTFESLDNRMIIVPFIASADSVLNFGRVFDQGTMIGNYTAAHDGLHQRVFATSRNMLIPTNIMTIKLDVDGLDAAIGLV